MAGNRKFSAFETEWLRRFAADIPKKDIKTYVIGFGGYIWHVFSWELLPTDSYLKGAAAMAAFDAADKTGAVCFEPFKEDAPLPAPESLTAELLEERVECYVMAGDGSWSYITTHEGDLCGPYFIRK